MASPTDDPVSRARATRPHYPRRRAGSPSLWPRGWVWLVVITIVIAVGAVTVVSTTASDTGTSMARAAPVSDASNVSVRDEALAASPTPPPAPRVPLPTVESCAPGSPIAICNLPRPTTTPTSPASGCTGEDCIPPPVTTPPATGSVSGQGGGSITSDCSFWDPSTWLSCLFAPIVTDALNGLLFLLGKTLLATPSPSSIPQLAALWTNSWQVLLGCYGLLVLVAGIVVMAYGTLQSRHSLKEIASRIPIGFLAGTLSLFAATKMIELANALAFALAGGPVNASSVATDLSGLITDALGGGIWLLFIGLVLAVMLVVLLVAYLVRVTITILLIAAAPVLLMFHALPQTDGLARWWWRAFAGVLAVQIAQSLVLALAINTLLAPATAALFGG